MASITKPGLIVFHLFCKFHLNYEISKSQTFSRAQVSFQAKNENLKWLKTDQL